MIEWISLRATAAAPGPFSHDKTIFASFLRREPWLYLMDSSEFMPTFKAVTVSVPGVEAPADIEGTRWRIRGALSCAICALT